MESFAETQHQALNLKGENRYEKKNHIGIALCYVKRLRESGLSIRQIDRLTGVSFNIVRKF